MTMQTTDQDDKLDAGESWGLLLILIPFLTACIGVAASIAGA